MNFYLSAACGLLAASMIACAPSAAPSSTPSAAASVASAAVVPPAAQPQAGATPDAQTEARIARVVAGLLPPFYTSAMRPWSLQERMAQHQVPGVSIAVIDGGKIAWARGFGVRDTASKVPVDAQTVFQAASVSKPIAAVAAMRLVQEGRLALDEDVDTRLRSWQVPASAEGIASPVTLRRLLTHRAGLGVPGFNGYAAGAQIPSTRQVLDGLPPANSPPVRVSFPMDGEYRYSGGGFTVLEQLVADTAEKPFARYTQDAVLKPLGMTRSAFVQPLAGELAANAFLVASIAW